MVCDRVSLHTAGRLLLYQDAAQVLHLYRRGRDGGMHCARRRRLPAVHGGASEGRQDVKEQSGQALRSALYRRADVRRLAAVSGTARTHLQGMACTHDGRRNIRPVRRGIFCMAEGKKNGSAMTCSEAGNHSVKRENQKNIQKMNKIETETGKK